MSFSIKSTTGELLAEAPTHSAARKLAESFRCALEIFAPDGRQLGYRPRAGNNVSPRVEVPADDVMGEFEEMAAE